MCDGFFFQAEDGIRDKLVTGVQTCALPISSRRWRCRRAAESAGRRRLARTWPAECPLCGGGNQSTGGGMSQTAVLLCGHGSRDPEAIGEFEKAAAGLRRRLADLAPGGDFATRYLEFAPPTIQEGLVALKARGGRRVPGDSG